MKNLKELVKGLDFGPTYENIYDGMSYDFYVNFNDYEKVFTALCDKDILEYPSSVGDDLKPFDCVNDMVLTVDTDNSVKKFKRMYITITIQEDELHEAEYEEDVSPSKVSLEELFKLLMEKGAEDN